MYGTSALQSSIALLDAVMLQNAVIPEIPVRREKLSVQTMVERASSPAFDVSSLLEISKNLTFRSTAEQRKLKREIARSQATVIDITDIFRMPQAWDNRGVGSGFPGVAVAPMKVAHIHYIRMTDIASGFYTRENWRFLGQRVLTGQGINRGEYNRAGTAPVPLVPRDLMPSDVTQRKTYVLFDVPSWENKKVEYVDPYLLERVSDHRFRVVAHWNLTDQERQIMTLLNR